MRAAVFVAVCLVCWSFAWSSASLQWLVLVLHDTYYVCVASRLWGSKVSRLTDYFLNSVSLYDSWRLERNNRTLIGLPPSPLGAPSPVNTWRSVRYESVALF